MNKSYNRKKNNARAVVTQGCYIFLEPFTFEDNSVQIDYCKCITKGYAVRLEYTKDPFFHNLYWKLFNEILQYNLIIVF